MNVSGVLLIALTLGLIAALIVAGVCMHRRAIARARNQELRLAVHADYELISALSANASAGLMDWADALRYLDRELSYHPHNVVVRRSLTRNDRAPHDQFMYVLRFLRSAHVLVTTDLERAEALAA